MVVHSGGMHKRGSADYSINDRAAGYYSFVLNVSGGFFLLGYAVDTAKRLLLQKRKDSSSVRSNMDSTQRHALV